MIRFFNFLLGTIFCVASFAAEIRLPLETEAFKEDPGAEIANAHCLICHSVEYVSIQPPLSRVFWKSSVQKMQQKYGATVPDDQVERLVDYLTKNYGATTNVAAAYNPPSSTQKGSTDILKGSQIAANYGCFGCHSITTKLVGPAFREIAAKYQSDAEAGSKIAQQIHQGGSGKWGPIIMPPFPKVSPGETKILTEWILGLIR
jgi:cytochrome c551/c552